MADYKNHGCVHPRSRCHPIPTFDRSSVTSAGCDVCEAVSDHLEQSKMFYRAAIPCSAWPILFRHPYLESGCKSWDEWVKSTCLTWAAVEISEFVEKRASQVLLPY